jgi:AcrR family transcriptional regulator
MEDKRVIKTKRNIKNTLVRLLQTTPFEKISVAELCREGVISRITFYTYYDSKYALLHELFSDYIKEADDTYHALQCKYHAAPDSMTGYENLLECILTLFYGHLDFFRHTTAQENPYLFSEFFNQVFYSVDDYLKRHHSLVPKYPTKQTAALICNGLFGVINVCSAEEMPEEDVRKIAVSMYRDLMKSNLFKA